MAIADVDRAGGLSLFRAPGTRITRLLRETVVGGVAPTMDELDASQQTIRQDLADKRCAGREPG